MHVDLFCRTVTEIIRRYGQSRSKTRRPWQKALTTGKKPQEEALGKSFKLS